MADEQITQTITPLPDVAGRFDADFIETADKFLSALPKNAEELNTFIAQFNELLKFVNTASAAAIAAQNVMGAWDSSVEYKHPCTVFYNGRRYASLQDSLDKQPDTETDYWLLIDGEGSNLDADTVDGKQASDLANYDLSNTDDSVILEKLKNVDGSGSELDADTVDGVEKELLGIGGDGYSWVDETDNRDFDVTYTNTYGKPILISAHADSSGGGTLSIKINDSLTISGTTDANDYKKGCQSVIIPNNATYEFLNSGNLTTLYVFELK